MSNNPSEKSKHSLPHCGSGSSMKLFSVSSSLNSRAYDFYRKIRSQLYSNSTNRIRSSRNGSVSDSLYSRISPLGEPNVSVVPVLDQWITEGKSTYKGELQRVIQQLIVYRRFRHALEVSLWMTNKRRIPIAPFDVAQRLKLIFKIFGLERVENYFNKIPEDLKTYHAYLALLNCYTMDKSVDKAESIMQKARDLGFASKPVWYNLMMNLYCHLGNREKVIDLLIEMETKGIPRDHFTHSVCLNACAMAYDAVGMDKIVKTTQSDPRGVVHLRTYVIAAEGYLKMGLIDKALGILNILEEQLETSKNSNILFFFLLKLYAEAGKKEDLYRIWNMYKKNGKIVNKVYVSMMRSLMKFDDVEGAEKIFEEWESSGLEFDFRVPDFLIDAYCTDGCLEKAKALIAKGKSKGGDPVITTWCHLARGYLRKDQVSEAVEAVKKALSVCPPRFKYKKDCLETCLGYLENGDFVKKAEELLKRIKTIFYTTRERDRNQHDIIESELGEYWIDPVCNTKTMDGFELLDKHNDFIGLSANTV